MSVTVSATDAYRLVRERAEEIRNDGDHRIETMSAGDAWAQGDVAIIALDAVPADAMLDESPSAQLAPGNTQGSRHLLDSLDGLRLFARTGGEATPLAGPVIEAERRFSVTHPEHGNVSLPPGVYQVRYQRAFAEELRRVQD